MDDLSTAARLRGGRPLRNVIHRHSHSHSHAPLASAARSRAGMRVVLVSLGLLGATALAQALIFLLTGSVALLADLTHNAGDAGTALPLAVAFLSRSLALERLSGYAVVAVMLVSAAVVCASALARLVAGPEPLDHLEALAAAGVLGFAGNHAAAGVRLRGGARLGSAALIADGHHARADALVSLGVVASALAVAAGAPIVDPLIGLLIGVLILRLSAHALATVRNQQPGRPALGPTDKHVREGDPI